MSRASVFTADMTWQMAIEEDPENASCIRHEHMERAVAGWKRQITPQMIEFYRRFQAGG
jgi:hypothetical protein